MELLSAPPWSSYPPPAYLVHLAVVIGLSFAVALASWHLIELPFLRLKRVFVGRDPTTADGAAPAETSGRAIGRE